MTRTLKLILVCTLVISSVFMAQTYNLPFFPVATVSASDENVTWDMLNQSLEDAVEELKIWFWSALSEIQYNISTYINESTEQLLDYISERTNFSQLNITLEGVTIEGVNESSILGRLFAIEDALGYTGNTSASVYDDLSAVLLGLVDNKGNYILRNSTGTSSFFLMGEMMMIIGTNQGALSTKITEENNATRTVVLEESGKIKSKVSTTGEWIAANSNNIASTIAAAGILFLLFWIFFLKGYLKRRSYIPDDRPPGTETETERNPEHNPGKVPTALSKLNPLNKTEGPPGCYTDGETYDPVREAACAVCVYASDCESAKIDVQSEIEMRKDAEMKKASSVTMNDQAMDQTTIPDMDMTTWGK